MLNCFKLLLLFLIVLPCVFANDDFVAPTKVDFTHYKAELTPDFQTQSVVGKVDIEFVTKTDKITQLNFSAKYKTIYSVKLNDVPMVNHIKDAQLIVTFKEPLQSNKSYQLSVEYQAKPERGMKFYEGHLFTVYHTKNWLVSHDAIADKASFELLLTHDANLTSAGNGRLISQQVISKNQVISHWLHDSPMPIYTFGFALGEFEEVAATHKNSQLSYLYRKNTKSGLTAKKIKQTFNNVPDMIDFFENKAGFTLPNQSYQYVVVQGYMAQEATGFSLVGENYVHTLLEDKNENWFVAHEIAHEWWGNSITCANFSHFWLNEGLVQFLVAAYKEHLFSDIAYKQEINLAIARVERAVKNNKISPVAYKHQIREHEINRTMAYSKGALVFYMLRNKLGDETFWRALKYYSIKHQDSSVTTDDLKTAFEKISEQDLSQFFNRWVYGEDIPELSL